MQKKIQFNTMSISTLREVKTHYLYICDTSMCVGIHLNNKILTINCELAHNKLCTDSGPSVINWEMVI